MVILLETSNDFFFFRWGFYTGFTEDVLLGNRGYSWWVICQVAENLYGKERGEKKKKK